MYFILQILDLLSDIFYYGALDPCIKCHGQITVNVKNQNYKCTNVGEWAICNFMDKFPSRRKMVIPDELYFQ